MMETKNKNGNTVDYDKWGHVILVSQLLIAGAVCLVEIVNNALLYVTRSQGYGPDTILQKLFRYLFLTTIINFGLILVSQLLVRKNKDNDAKKFILIIATILICTDVAFSHYQFADTLVIFVIPLVISILYEDFSLTNVTLLFCFVGQTIAVVARAADADYNKDIGPEAAIAYAFTISVYLFCRLILKTLLERRKMASEAIIAAEKNNAAIERMRISMKMLETLAKTLDAKDKYTNGHAARVAVYATILAKEIGWSEEQIETLRFQAMLHDIGKIGVPDLILNKPDRLTDTEFSLIKSHTLVGAEILKDMVVLPEAKEVAKFHHERYDGKGYPIGLKGNAIPLSARIVGIADAFDAMNSDRIYRKALPRNVIREELVKGRGTQFDPDLLDIFLELFDKNKFDVRIDTSRLNSIDKEQEYVMEDINNILNNISNAEQLNRSMEYFDKFYIYMRNIGIRYNRSIEVMSFHFARSANYEDAVDHDPEASQALEAAIKKNIRAVDVHFQYSLYQHMVILLDAGIGNIDVIAQRVIFDFNQTKFKGKYDVTYELNENVNKIAE